jgi:uncharacterized LabA/DUF88 family protein
VLRRGLRRRESGVCSFRGRFVKTNIYIDAFNLYYGAVIGTRYRWLNVRRMCELLLPDTDIGVVKYFTARVTSWPHDPQKHVRQQVYLRALRSLDNVQIIYGHFLTHQVRMPLANQPSGSVRWANVVKTEEKGSDVNLACHLIVDGFEDAFDQAVVVSNDSDLVEPIRVVRNKLGKPVGILNPQKHPSKALRQHSTFFKSIRPGVLSSSQLPETIQDQHGLIRKPTEWM